MQTSVILLVFVCSVLSAPVGQKSSGIVQSSPFAIGPVQIVPSVNQISASTTTSTGLLSTETTPVISSLRSWLTPSNMTDLSCFNVSGKPSGNVQVITQGIPAQYITASSVSSPTSDSKGPVIQVFYPQGSINPANTIVGGANFYAVPLSLSGARNVSLEYSVFFPLDFEWVQGGKLPGLYGGHKSCSGGDSALSCFSTRLMWRGKGAGELYLYAPKDKQTEALCSAPPLSVCESSYGLSIARGSFSFTPGKWTHLKQTVYLNTPGEQDGAFFLEVNGEPVIDRKDVYYRNNLNDVPQTTATVGPQPLLMAPTKRLMEFLTARSSTTQLKKMRALVPEDPDSSKSSRTVGFTGLFFSTFFGGHTESWATPKDQYTWFKDFAINVNS